MQFFKNHFCTTYRLVKSNGYVFLNSLESVSELKNFVAVMSCVILICKVYRTWNIKFPPELALLYLLDRVPDPEVLSKKGCYKLFVFILIVLLFYLLKYVECIIYINLYSTLERIIFC